MEQISNKQIVVEVYRQLIRDQNLELIDKYVHDDYIQHSPTLKDGKSGLIEALSYLKSLPKPPESAPSPIVRIIAEGDLVMAHLDIKFAGKHLAVVDIFRLKEEKLIEHWSVEQEVPDIMPHGNGMF
ncbi:MAG TPA: ester cyclase [Mucilaginibacter sp.]|nr:ester cyclase [Mucilaginibacter sp.]